MTTPAIPRHRSMCPLPSCHDRSDGLPVAGLAATLLAMGSALGVAIALDAPASAVTLADNLGETTTTGILVGYIAPGAQPTWQGMKFNTTSASIINSVTVKLTNGAGTPATQGNVFFDIYTSNGSGLPGTAVGTIGSLVATSLAAAGSPTDYTFSSLGLALNANST